MIIERTFARVGEAGSVPGPRLPWWYDPHPVRIFPTTSGYSTSWAYAPYGVAWAMRLYFRAEVKVIVALYCGGFLDVEEGGAVTWGALTLNYPRVWRKRVERLQEQLSDARADQIGRIRDLAAAAALTVDALDSGLDKPPGEAFIDIGRSIGQLRIALAPIKAFARRH